MKKKMRYLSFLLAFTMFFSSTGIMTYAKAGNETMLEVISVEESIEQSIEESQASSMEEVLEETASGELTAGEENAEETTQEEGSVREEDPEESTFVETQEETVVESMEETGTEEIGEETEETPEETEEIREEIAGTLEENEGQVTIEASSAEISDLEPVESGEFFEFPGLKKNVVLSKEDKENKGELRQHQSEILEMTEGVDYIAGEIMVAADSLEEAQIYAQAFGGTLKKYSEGPKYALIQLPQDATVGDAVKAASIDENGLPAAWPNYIMRLYEENIENEVYPEGISSYDDENLGEQWFHEYIGSQWAWLCGYTGEGVSVGIVDSGILTTHEDLEANAQVGEFWATNSADEQGQEWTTDANGHGTHVAGIVAADGKNGVGGSGVAPDAKVKGYTVVNSSGSGTLDWVMDGFYAAMEDGHDIINMSLGGGGYSSIFQGLCVDAYEAGIFVVAASGNESTSGTTYPACYDHVCAIGAIEASGGAAAFSNFGPWVDLAFPGADIFSTYKGSSSSYQVKNGTSMASPVAAGVAAVLLSAHMPELEGKTGPAKVDALEAVMKSAVKKSTTSGMGKGTTYLPKVLNISDEITTPQKPQFSVAAGTYKQETLEVEITGEKGFTTIYYSTNGKDPVYKNGKISNGQIYAEPITIAQKQITLKAIAVNASGISSKVATAKYTLKPVQVREVKLEVKSGTHGILQRSGCIVGFGNSVTFKPIFTPAYATDKSVIWDVEPKGKGVTVKDGVVTVSKNAAMYDYVITVRMKNYSIPAATYIVAVCEPTVKSMAFSKQQVKLTQTVDNPSPTANLLDILKISYVSGQVLEEHYLNWYSSNPEIASVDKNGLVTALKSGTVTITVIPKDGSGPKATCKVKVKSHVTKITLSGSSEVAKGKSIKLQTDIQPAKAANANFIWSVEPAGQGVSVKNGKVTVTGKADTSVVYKITAATKDGTVISEPHEVKIVDGAIKSIKLPGKATIFTTEGNSEAPTQLQLQPTIKGSTGFKDSLIVYSSSNPTVATVDANTGLVKAKAVGKTVITCKALDGSNKSAKITVHVNIPMARIKIAPTKGLSGYIAKGKKVKFTVLAGTDFGAPTNAKVKWTVEDKTIASIDSSGKVTGKKIGTTTIVATAADGSNVTASYRVHIVKAPSYFDLYYLKLSDSSNVGTLYFISDGGILEETQASGYKVDIKGPKSNGNVGCVVEKQYLDAVDLRFDTEIKGTYTITVTLLDGSNKKKSIKIKY